MCVCVCAEIVLGFFSNNNIIKLVTSNKKDLEVNKYTKPYNIVLEKNNLRKIYQQSQFVKSYGSNDTRH